MTNKSFPITPPFELMNQWYKKACKDPYNGGKFIMAPVLKDISNSAAQWGADAELDACLEWISKQDWTWTKAQLLAARRPKPLSEADQALAMLNDTEVDAIQYDTIRRALERLKKLEESNND